MATGAILFAGITLTDAATWHDYHFGRAIPSWRPAASTFFGIYSEGAIDDETAAANILLLSDFLGELGKADVSPREIRETRRLKLIRFPSVFVSVYEYFRLHNTQFILNDLKNDSRWRLNDFELDDFNSFIRLQGLAEPYDYVYLAKLFLVLTDFGEEVFFMDGVYAIFDAIDERWSIFKLENAILEETHEKYDDVLKEPFVSTGKLGIEVTLFTYDLRTSVLRHVITFQGTQVADVKSSGVVDRDDLLMILGFEVEKVEKQR